MIPYKAIIALFVAFFGVNAFGGADPMEAGDTAESRHVGAANNKSEYNPIQNKQTVKPGALQPVTISQSDVNLVQCQAGAITDRTYSTEKPLIYEPGKGTDGKISYIKLQQQEVDGEVRYYTKELELYVTCGGEVYSLMLVPKDVRTQHLILSPGRSEAMNRNLAMFGELDLEEAAVTLIDKVQFEADLPASFSVSDALPGETNWKTVSPYVRARLIRSVKPDGVGLVVHEYVMFTEASEATLSEFDFVKLHDNTFAVRLSGTVLQNRQPGRAYVVERLWR